MRAGSNDVQHSPKVLLRFQVELKMIVLVGQPRVGSSNFRFVGRKGTGMSAVLTWEQIYFFVDAKENTE